MKRYIEPCLRQFLEKKMVLLMGPRQVGKTTVAKGLSSSSLAYHNYDVKKDLAVFRDQQWDRSKELVVFDELHKMKKWKLWLKGIYDEGLVGKQKFLITGSARLDVAKKMGDSLAGRFFSIRLNPLDLKELRDFGTAEENYKKLLTVSGFPEPLIEGTESGYHLWRRTHSDLILKQDLITLENVRDIDGMEVLIELLAERVGSTISCNSLARDLGRSDKTVKHWLDLLERMFLVFRVSPYSKNISRGIKKAGKYYFYDCARVEGGEAAKLENLVALSLKKELEFLEDCRGIPGRLYFVQTKDQRELDFLVIQKSKPAILIEVKLSDGAVSRNFELFGPIFPGAKQVQLVRNLDRAYLSKEGVRVSDALEYLTHLNFA